MGRGFLGTAASRASDLVLLTELGMGLALTFGAVLARRRRFRAHAFCQSAVVLLNLPLVLLYLVYGVARALSLAGLRAHRRPQPAAL